MTGANAGSDLTWRRGGSGAVIGQKIGATKTDNTSIYALCAKHSSLDTSAELFAGCALAGSWAGEMQRYWKTHDVVDLFRSVRAGHIPCNCNQFTNGNLSDDPQIRIKKLDPNWPQHMDMDRPDTEPEYKIEAGVPVPAINRRTQYKWVPTLFALEPGQSFLIPVASPEEGMKVMITARHHMNKSCHGKMFITRRIKASAETPQMGVRIWRVS